MAGVKNNELAMLEDEIDLSVYLAILWKRRRFILVFSILPSLIFALVLFASPGDCRVSYTFDIGPAEEVGRMSTNHLFMPGEMNVFDHKSEKDRPDDENHKAFLQEFRKPENLNRFVDRLKNSLDENALDVSGINLNLQTSDSSLTLSVAGHPTEDVRRISSILKGNLEKIVRMNLVRSSLYSSISVLRAMMTDNERNRFAMELDLEKEKAILTRLKELEPVDSNYIPSGILLNVDGSRESREFLPVAYQAQVVNAGIIEIEETISADQEMYACRQSVLALDVKLLGEIMNNESSYYTPDQFRSFLTTMAGKYKDKKNYLTSHVRALKDVLSTKVPVIDGPAVEFVSKGIAKKTTIVFVLLLALTTFSAFLRESIGKHLTKAP